MEPQRLVDLGHDGGRHPAESGSESLDGDRTDLLSLSLGVDAKAGSARRHEDLKREDPRGAAGKWDHGDDSSSQALDGGVGAIVADHDGGPPFGGLAAPYGIEIHQANLSAVHQDRPSPAAISHRARSPEHSQSSQAAA